MAMDSPAKKCNKEKYMCQLVFERGLHSGKTCPLLVILYKSENVEKKRKADVQIFSMDEHTIQLIKTPTNALIGEFKQQHPIGPVIWEQTRQEVDAYIIVRIISLPQIFKNMHKIHHQLQVKHLVKLQKNI